MPDYRTFRASPGRSGKGAVVGNAKLERPGEHDSTCVHPQCHREAQARYEFPLPLCGEHLVRTLAAAIEVTRAAKRDYVEANDGKRMPFPIKARLPMNGELVYYVRFGDRIKIGTTKNLMARLQTLPCDEILATEPGGPELERQRHQQFAADLVSGREWFNPSEPLIAHIAGLKRR